MHYVALVITKEGQTVEELMWPYKELDAEPESDPRYKFNIKVVKEDVEKYAADIVEWEEDFLQRHVEMKERFYKEFENGQYDDLIEEMGRWVYNLVGKERENKSLMARACLNRLDDIIKETKDVLERYEVLIKERNFSQLLFSHEGFKKDDNGNFGFYRNPKSYWDWYKIGGRWSCSKLEVREANMGEKGEGSLMHPSGFIGAAPLERKKNFVDVAYLKDITKESLKELTSYVVLDENGWVEKGDGCYIPKTIDKNVVDEYTDPGAWWPDYINGIKERLDKAYNLQGDKYILKDDFEDVDNYIMQHNFFTEESWQQNYYDRFIKNLDPNVKLTVVDYHI